MCIKDTVLLDDQIPAVFHTEFVQKRGPKAKGTVMGATLNHKHSFATIIR